MGLYFSDKQYKMNCMASKFCGMNFMATLIIMQFTYCSFDSTDTIVTKRQATP